MAKDLRIRDEQGNLLYPVTVTDLVFDDQTGETLTEKLEGKQDTISDLSTIRSGASAGSTAYQKPSGGIPKTDLASAVQTSLGKADTALQTHQDISGKQDVLVSGTNIKTVNNTSLLGSGNISIPKGDPGEDGEDAYQPFKGWFDSSSALSSAYPSPQVGDFAYVKGATSTDPVAIYACATAGTWADSGNTFNPANNQEFASGEALNTVHIVDGLESSLATDVLSAKQGNVLDQKVAALGPKIDKNEADIEALQDEVVEVGARAGSYDHIPLLGGQPMILFGSGAPVEANVPENWIGFNDGGFEWIGTPSMMGQQYIDTANGEKYVSIKNGFTLSWLKV